MGGTIYGVIGDLNVPDITRTLELYLISIFINDLEHYTLVMSFYPI